MVLLFKRPKERETIKELGLAEAEWYENDKTHQKIPEFQKNKSFSLL